ncbi:MAG: YlxR family protein [Defluviitaleaceae bacterium]|nr:YlxR family protein [Defluviitaleaceae bacterium]
MINKAALVRVALDKTGAINIDPTGKMHGRAAYLCSGSECLQKAQKSKGLERSFKRSVPPEVYLQLEKILSVSVSH